MGRDMVDQIVALNEQVDMSAEEQHNQEMIAKVDGNGVPTERPEMDDSDQFQGDYNKLKQSYDALRSKMDSGEVDVPVDVQEELGIPQDPEVAQGAFDISALTQEYTQNGGLSDKSYKQLEDGGISREMANQYIAGQKALGEQIGNQVKNEVGGQEEYGSMVEWAKNNYTQDQIKAYDAAVNSGNIELAKMAARGLKADYVNKEGSEGKTYSGTQAPPEGGSDVFRSNAEVTTAMKDPRYEYDTAFRQDVLNKLDRSDIFSQGKL
jgi:hypothetical protein